MLTCAYYILNWLIHLFPSIFSIQFLMLSLEISSEFRMILRPAPAAAQVKHLQWKETLARTETWTFWKIGIFKGKIMEHQWLQQRIWGTRPGKLTVCELENGHRNSDFSHETCWFSIAMLVYQRVSFLKNLKFMFFEPSNLLAPHILQRFMFVMFASEWRRSDQAVSVPGSWYPDDRFQRLFWVKRGMPQPKDYQAWHESGRYGVRCIWRIFFGMDMNLNIVGKCFIHGEIIDNHI